MIGYLDGKILENQEDRILLAVGDPEQGRVGYLIAVPKRAEYLQLTSAMRVSFYIYSHIREDAFDLYGFLTTHEKEMFQCLISVNGVGPKMALSILSNADPGRIHTAVATQNASLLKGIPGVGSKTVDRLLMELKTPLKKREGHWTSLPPTSATVMDSIYVEAKQALLGLGYRESEIDPLLSQCAKNFEHPPENVSAVIREALRQRGPSQ